MEIIEVRTYQPPEGSGLIGHVREVRVHVPESDEADVAAGVLGDVNRRTYRTVQTFIELFD